MLSGYEIILILALALIFFGAKKIPELARGLGQGMREFRKASREVTGEIENMMESDHYSQKYPAPAAPTSEVRAAGLSQSSATDAAKP